MFHFMIQDGITYLCMSDKSFPRRICFTFLEDIKNNFLQRYSFQQIQGATAFGLNQDFSGILIQRMVRNLSLRFFFLLLLVVVAQCGCFQQNYYSHDPSADQISQAKHQIEATKAIMVENIGQKTQTNTSVIQI